MNARLRRTVKRSRFVLIVGKHLPGLNTALPAGLGQFGIQFCAHQ
jgi:hypothetical protein